MIDILRRFALFRREQEVQYIIDIFSNLTSLTWMSLCLFILQFITNPILYFSSFIIYSFYCFDFETGSHQVSHTSLELMTSLLQQHQLWVLILNARLNIASSAPLLWQMLTENWIQNFSRVMLSRSSNPWFQVCPRKIIIALMKYYDQTNLARRGFICLTPPHHCLSLKEKLNGPETWRQELLLRL